MWDEDALAIVFEVSVSRSIDPDVVWARKYDLCALAREKLPEDTYAIFDAAISKVTSSYSQYIQPGFDGSAVEELCGVTCSVGQRTSRIINKVCRHFGVDLLPDYNAKFAELADALNPLSLSRTAALSVHPCDYLEMSNTRNSWSSCHNLEDGCYRAGTLSYLADESAMIFYTVDGSEDRAMYARAKITREVFCYSHGLLLQSRLYPNYEDMDTWTTYRSIVQAAMAVCEGEPNYWSLHTDMDTVSTYVETHDDAHHYTDYTYEGYHPSISLLKSVDTEGSCITVGSTSHCLRCSRELDDAENLLCEFCNDRCYCEACGCSMSTEDGYYINGYYYCRDCVNFCEMCEGAVREGLTDVTDEYGNTISVCDSCLEEHVDVCADCGQYFTHSALAEFDGRVLCEDCLDAASEAEPCTA